MSYPNQPPHVFPFLPPPFIHPPMGGQLPVTAAPIMLPKPATTVAPVAENPSRYATYERPITTVFIGNISDKISDPLLKEALAKCGNVLSWKRVQGASGKLQAFGFCEYDNPEATLRCIRLLNDFMIADKALVVKVDPKTDELLTEYKNKKQKAIEDREAEDVSKTEEAKKERINAIYAREKDDDNNSLNQIKKLIKESCAELLNEESEKKAEAAKSLNIEEIDLDGDKRNLISREIESFRNKHKDDETNEEKEERYRRLREREKERRREKDKERSTDGKSHRRHRSKSRSKTSKKTPEKDRARKRSREDSRASSVISKKRRSGSKDTSKSHSKSKRESEKEVDGYEAAVFKKLEKKLRDKETAYQKRLQMWEQREKKRQKDYEMEEERRSNKEAEVAEEARKLQVFFEDYDDEKWDLKYYRGAELERRYGARRAEEVSDERDRAREVEQIEATRARLTREDHPDAEAIILKMERSMQEHLVRRLPDAVVEADGEEAVPMETDGGSGETVLEEPEAAAGSEDGGEHTPVNTGAVSVMDTHTVVSEEGTEEKADTKDECAENERSSAPQTNPSTNGEISNNVEEDASETSKPQLTHSSNVSTTEKNALVKKIIDGIPTLKADLFAYPIEWKMVDSAFVESRIKPWVDKKITSYIGEEEPSLSDFICDQLLQNKTPDEILGDVAMVLEEEADVFVMKMWRLLIYVIEERKCGLDKVAL